MEGNQIQKNKLICRICLSSDLVTNCFFDKIYKQLSLAEILKKYIFVESQPNQFSPSMVCKKCTSTIIEFDNLAIIFKKREQYWLDFREYFKSEMENIDTVDDDSETNEHFENDAENQCETEQKNKVEADFKEDINYQSCFDDSGDSKMNDYSDSDITQCGKYSCEICGDCYLIRAGFRRHMMVKHNVILEENECDNYCTKISAKIPLFFPVQSKTKPETQNIPVEKNTRCKICSEEFNTVQELKTHCKIHKTFICEVCGASFLKKSYLQEHTKVHQEKSIKCKECGKYFAHRSSLRRHKFTHGTSRGYTCDTCGQGFKSKPNLDVHIQAKHIKEKKYHCSECDMSFVVKSWLDKHFRRRHTLRKKDFICSECGSSYMEKSTLQRHFSEKHCGKERVVYPCCICEKMYPENRRLQRHLRSKHSMNLTEGELMAFQNTGCKNG